MHILLSGSFYTFIFKYKRETIWNNAGLFYLRIYASIDTDGKIHKLIRWNVISVSHISLKYDQCYAVNHIAPRTEIYDTVFIMPVMSYLTWHIKHWCYTHHRFHFVRPSVCGQNRVWSVSSTIIVGSISYLDILSSNFRWCVAYNVCIDIQIL